MSATDDITSEGLGTPAECSEIIARYRQDPIAFMVEALDVDPSYVWPKMREVAESVRDNIRTAAKAAHSVSKTYSAARIALWFLVNFPPASVITTAPTHTLVKEQLWREIREAHTNARIPIGGKLTSTALDFQAETGKKWFALGFSTKPDTVTQEATRMQGFHNKHLLLIFDEAAGILREIWEAAESLMASGFVRFLAIGNPVSSRGNFVRCFRDPEWHKITISTMDTPNYKQDKEVVPGLSGRRWERECRERFGVESAYYQARVLGRIPKTDVDTVIHVDDLEDAYNRKFIHAKPKRRYVACDPADGGDETVMYYMEDTDILDELIMQKKNTMITAGTARIFCEKHGTKNFIGDSIGIGKGICDRLDEMGLNVVMVNSSERQASGVPDIYFNRRAEMWCGAGEEFSMGDISLRHKCVVLKEQLLAIKQTVRNGRIIIEPKDKIRADLGRSPDRGDTYVIGLFGRRYVTPDVKETKDRWSEDKVPAGSWAD